MISGFLAHVGRPESSLVGKDLETLQPVGKSLVNTRPFIAVTDFRHSSAQGAQRLPRMPESPSSNQPQAQKLDCLNDRRWELLAKCRLFQRFLTGLEFPVGESNERGIGTELGAPCKFT